MATPKHRLGGRPTTHRAASRHPAATACSAVVALVLVAVTLSAFATSSAAEAEPISLLPDDHVPQIAVDPDRVPVELGMRFTTTAPVSVVAVQLYRGPGNLGSRRATLWTGSGRVLAQVMLGPRRSAGLQTVLLDDPVVLASDSTYVVSYSARYGRYAVDEDFFEDDLSNGPLSATADAGVYTYRTGAFPQQAYRASNYNIDVVVVPVSPQETPTDPGSPTPTDTTSPTAPTGSPTEPPSDTFSPTPTDPSGPSVTTSPSDTGGPTPSDTGSPTPTDTGSPTPTDSGSPTPTDTGSPTPSDPGSPSPTDPTDTPSPTSTPSPTGTPTPTTPPTDPPAFPTRASAGLPAGWTPQREVRGDLWIRTANAVVEDVRVTDGVIYVDAPNVTLRRVQGVNARVVNDYNNVCKNGLLIESSQFTSDGSDDLEVIGPGGYTARNIVVDDVPEALRAGGKSVGCGPVTVEGSFIRITPPTNCADWHGDGIQGYDGPRLTVRRTTIIMEETASCSGTAPFFYPSGQGNTSIDVDGLLVSGGGYSFRNGMPGSVRNLYVVDRRWGYAPVDVDCGALSVWQAWAATLSADGQPVAVRPLGCSGVGN